MRKLMLFVFILLSMCSVNYAFDAASSIGVGMMAQKGLSPELGYFVGFTAPIVTKTEAGYTFKQQTDYLYSGFTDQIKAIRVYALNEKTFITRPNWGMYAALGTGIWQFIETGDGESAMLGSVMARLGGTVSIFDFTLSGEAVQQPGADLAFVSFGVGLKF